MKRKAVFFDRDGVINLDYGYVGHKDNFRFIPGVFQALKHLHRRGYLLILVTNQSGIARGYYSESDFASLCAWMQLRLQAYAAPFDGIYYCPHHPQAAISSYRQDCACRKPKPGMLLKAQKDFNLDLAQCVMIGDHAGDLIAAKRSGVHKLILVGKHIGSEHGRIPEAKIRNTLADCLDLF